jgi:hypothetical protein
MRFVALFVLTLLLAGCGKAPAPSTDSRDRNFEAQMKGVTLVGYSTRAGQQGLSGEERYIIEKVSRLAGNTWLFQSRFQTGGREWPAPIPVNIEWAGDTPVITLTDLKIPGLGTFTARVLLYRDQYAGTWSSATEGGQMFGRIVKTR